MWWRAPGQRPFCYLFILFHSSLCPFSSFFLFLSFSLSILVRYQPTGLKWFLISDCWLQFDLIQSKIIQFYLFLGVSRVIYANDYANLGSGPRCGSNNLTIKICFLFLNFFKKRNRKKKMWNWPRATYPKTRTKTSSPTVKNEYFREKNYQKIKNGIPWGPVPSTTCRDGQKSATKHCKNSANNGPQTRPLLSDFIHWYSRANSGVARSLNGKTLKNTLLTSPTSSVVVGGKKTRQNAERSAGRDRRRPTAHSNWVLIGLERWPCTAPGKCAVSTAPSSGGNVNYIVRTAAHARRHAEGPAAMGSRTETLIHCLLMQVSRLWCGTVQ